jgi:hypothetical protein
MAGFSAPRRQPPVKGRHVVMYGAQGSGKSLVSGLLAAASNKVCAIVTSEDLEASFSRFDEGAPLAEVVFVELSTASQLERLIHVGILDATRDAVVVKVIPEGFDSGESAHAWALREREIEACAQMHSLPLHAVVNQKDDPMSACIGLAQAAKLKS